MKKDIPIRQVMPQPALARACSLWAPIDLTKVAPKNVGKLVNGSQKDSTDTLQESLKVYETGDTTAKVK